MVVVNYVGRLGNNLFQYALGRYLAEEKGYELTAAPLPFQSTFEKVTGKCYREAQIKIGPYHIDIPALIKNDKEHLIILEGYFQHYKFYIPFIDRIRQWYSIAIPNTTINAINHDDLLIYVRLSDYFHHGWVLNYSYYASVINIAKPRRIFIVTEDRNHPFLRNFDIYSPIIISRDTMSDFLLARAFKKIALSCSTFSWWAALLAEPEEVYFPIGQSGLWSYETMQFPNYNQDLRIDDSRYIYFYNCPRSDVASESFECIPLDEAKPEQEHMKHFVSSAIDFHSKSKAYWILQ